MSSNHGVTFDSDTGQISVGGYFFHWKTPKFIMFGSLETMKNRKFVTETQIEEVRKLVKKIQDTTRN